MVTAYAHRPLSDDVFYSAAGTVYGDAIKHTVSLVC